MFRALGEPIARHALNLATDLLERWRRSSAAPPIDDRDRFNRNHALAPKNKRD
jgi:hypothetical protein